MGLEAVKLEIIEWLTKLEDPEILSYLKIVKDSSSIDKDWWNDLSYEEKKGIEQGLKDIEEGNVIAHEDVIKKYGLLFVH